MRKPKVFLFDEPLSNLDAALRINTRVEIAKLHKLLGATILYVTHDQVEAMTLADKIVVMNQGRIEQVGKPLELYYKPANLFVARFIGSPAMNILTAVVNTSGTSAKLQNHSISLLFQGPPLGLLSALASGLNIASSPARAFQLRLSLSNVSERRASCMRALLMVRLYWLRSRVIRNCKLVRLSTSHQSQSTCMCLIQRAIESNILRQSNGRARLSFPEFCDLLREPCGRGRAR